MQLVRRINQLDPARKSRTIYLEQEKVAITENKRND